MGLILRLKAFFNKLTRRRGEGSRLTAAAGSLQVGEVKPESASLTGIVGVEVKEPVIQPLRIEPEAKSEIQLLYEEYERLSKEKENIRLEIAELDKRLTAGELNPAERDRIFREKMVKVVSIAQRMLEIRSRCAELGKPIE